MLKAFNEQALRAAGKHPEQTNTPPSLDHAQAAAALLELLKEYDPILDELRAASRRPYARFNVHYDELNPAGILLPRLTKLKCLARILSLRAAAELKLGQTEAALGDVSLAFYLADSMRKEPILISHLVRIVIVELALQPVWEGLADHRWTDMQLQALQQRLREFDFLADDLFAMRGERAFGNAIVSFLRQNRSVLPQLGDPFLDGEANAFGFLASQLSRGWFYLEQLNYDRLFEERVLPGMEPASRRVYPRLIRDNAESLTKDLRAGWSPVIRHRLLASMLLPAVTQAHREFAYVQTMVDEATVACALERHRPLAKPRERARRHSCPRTESSEELFQ